MQQYNVSITDLVKIIELSKVKVKIAPIAENKYFTYYAEVVDANKLIYNLKELGRNVL